MIIKDRCFPHARADVLQGIMARVYETSVVLILLAILVTSIVWVGLALIDRGRTIDEGNYNEPKPATTLHYLQNAPAISNTCHR